MVQSTYDVSKFFGRRYSFYFTCSKYLKHAVSLLFTGYHVKTSRYLCNENSFLRVELSDGVISTLFYLSFTTTRGIHRDAAFHVSSNICLCLLCVLSQSRRIYFLQQNPDITLYPVRAIFLIFHDFIASMIFL